MKNECDNYYVKISIDNYNRLQANSRVLNDMDNLDYFGYSIGGGYPDFENTYYSCHESEALYDFETKIKRLEVINKELRDKINQPKIKKEGFWRSFGTAIYRTP